MAADYVRSLKEYTVFNEEKGRYFDTHRAGYSWCNYTIPTQVAAIEALSLVTPADEQTIDQLSGYHWGYYIDRVGQYKTGTCTMQCAYSPEYSARTKSLTITVE